MVTLENKIVFVFNRILINFFKEIKREKYFKIAIKKNYKVIDKKSDKHIKYFSKKMFNNIEFLCNPELDLNELQNNEDLRETNIFKNINIGKLFNHYKDVQDRKIIVSYILTLSLLTILYNDCIMIKQNKLFETVSDDKEEILDDDDDDDDDNEADENEDDNNEEDDKNEEGDNKEEDNDTESDSEMDAEEVLDMILTKSLKILNSIDNNDDVENDLNDIMDDDVKILLLHIKNLKVDVTNDVNIDNNDSIDELLGNSKIGKLAKEISSQIDLESLNINTENPEELLSNPANLFTGESGNLIGNLVQQVGSSITEKMNSGELKQEDLVKDAFSLMNKMQNSKTDNPIIDDMVKNMMNMHESENTNNVDMNGGMDINSMMQQMMSGMGGMNPDMMQQMMNNMGGSQAVNQNNPNSREGKQKERLRKKLAEKKLAQEKD